MLHEVELVPPDGLNHLSVMDEQGMTEKDTDFITYDPMQKELITGERFVLTVEGQVRIVSVREVEQEVVISDFYTGNSEIAKQPYSLLGRVTKIGRTTLF